MFEVCLTFEVELDDWLTEPCCTFANGYFPNVWFRFVSHFGNRKIGLLHKRHPQLFGFYHFPGTAGLADAKNSEFRFYGARKYAKSLLIASTLIFASGMHCTHFEFAKNEIISKCICAMQRAPTAAVDCDMHFGMYE